MSLVQPIDLPSLHLFISLHYTPAKMFHMGLGAQACCSRCGEVSGSLMHMFWTCSHLSIFWSNLFILLETKLGFQDPKFPAGCLLWIPKDFIPLTYSHIIFHLLFFYVKPSLWIRKIPAMVQQVCHLVNYTLPKYRIVYTGRAYLKKCTNIWQPHLDIFASQWADVFISQLSR